MEEDQQRLEEVSASDPAAAAQATAPPPRHKKWKAARMKGGKYINEAVAEVAGRIVSADI